MSHPNTIPADVATRISTDGDTTYVDVRTVAEFVLGHPRGRVINVPVEFYHPKTDAAHANASFVLVMEHCCAKDLALVVGADDGPRALAAADALKQAGFSNVQVMTAGFSGWKTSGLPVTGNNADGVSYVSLLTPAKRQGHSAPAHHD